MNIYYEMFYFILVGRGLKSIKLEYFFSTHLQQICNKK